MLVLVGLSIPLATKGLTGWRGRKEGGGDGKGEGLGRRAYQRENREVEEEQKGVLWKAKTEVLITNERAKQRQKQKEKWKFSSNLTQGQLQFNSNWPETEFIWEKNLRHCYLMAETANPELK